MARHGGGDSLFSAKKAPSAMTDDLAWAESITLWLADSWVDGAEYAGSNPPVVDDDMDPGLLKVDLVRSIHPVIASTPDVVPFRRRLRHRTVPSGAEA